MVKQTVGRREYSLMVMVLGNSDSTVSAVHVWFRKYRSIVLEVDTSVEAGNRVQVPDPSRIQFPLTD